MPSFSDPPQVTAADCLAVNYVARRTASMSPDNRARHLRAAARFQRFLLEVEAVTVDAITVDRWAGCRLQEVTAATVLLEVYRLRRILDGLASNPVTEWLSLHPRIKKTLRKLKTALPPQPVPPPYTSILAADMEAFLNHKRRLGRKYLRTESLLRRFDRFLVARNVTSLEQVDRYLLSDYAASLDRLQPSTRHLLLSALPRFFHFLRRMARLTSTPDAVLRPKRVRHPRPPYVFTLKEFTTVLEALRAAATWDAETAFVAVFLVYACGLRSSEATRLRVQDVDLVQDTLWIHRTKFGKSRHIPMGTRASQRLTEYLESRRQRFGASAPDSPFFINHWGRAFQVSFLRIHFRRACREAGVTGNGRSTPRLHDLRHSFALHRLYKWYVDGCRPQDKLVLLSIYMGHVHIDYTEHYLQSTTDLLRLAGAACGRQLDDFLTACRRHG